MLDAVRGHYDGTNIVTDEKVTLRTGQPVIITILSDMPLYAAPSTMDLSQYMGRGERMFHGNVDEYVEGLRSDDRL